MAGSSSGASSASRDGRRRPVGAKSDVGRTRRIQEGEPEEVEAFAGSLALQAGVAEDDVHEAVQAFFKHVREEVEDPSEIDDADAVTFFAMFALAKVAEENGAGGLSDAANEPKKTNRQPGDR